jgi:outer membrane protein assembly factor BamB
VVPALGGATVGTLTAVGGTLSAPVVASSLAGTYTFDATTGAATSHLGFHVITPSPLVFRGDTQAYISGAFGSGGPFYLQLFFGSQVAAIDGFSSGGSFLAQSGPTIVGQHVLVGYGTTVLSFSMDTCPPTAPGSNNACFPEWTATLPGVTTAPVGIDADHAAVATADGTVTALNLADGSVAWSAATGATGLTAPALARGRLYAGAANGSVYALDAAGCGAATCSPRWSVSTGTAAISHQPAVAGEVVFAGTANGQVVAFRSGCATATCAVLWHAAVSDAAPGGAVSGPIIANATVYAATSSGGLAAFHLPAS